MFQLSLTSVPGEALPESPLAWLDVVAHAGLYGVLGALVARAAALAAWPPSRLPVLVAAIALGAAVDEWHQGFIPERSPALGDWIADLAGGTAGLTAGAFMMRSRLAAWLR